MKKYFAVILALGLLASGCAKQTDSNSRTIARRAGQGSGSVVDSQAKSIGLDVIWQKTELNSSGVEVPSVTHTYTINGNNLTFTHDVETWTYLECSNAASTQFATAQVSANAGVTSSVGHLICRNEDNLYLGLTFMASNNSSYVTQEFVLLNLTTKADAIMVQKQVTSQASRTMLNQWVAYLFNEE